MLLPLLLACTATIRATATPDAATLYLTNERPTGEARPSTYVAKSEGGELRATVSYYIWQQWYVWAGAPGYTPEVVEVPQEPKVGPIVGAVLVWFPVIWAVGPSENAVIDIELEPSR